MFVYIRVTVMHCNDVQVTSYIRTDIKAMGQDVLPWDKQLLDIKNIARSGQQFRETDYIYIYE